MPEIVIRERTVPRALAVFPAIVVAGCVRVLTLGTPPIAVRLLAAAAVALACWTAYRLLTSSVAVTDEGVHVRGVLYDAQVPWGDLEAVAVGPAGTAVRLMLWGILQPRAVTLTCAGRTLRPIAMLSSEDDDEVERAVGAMRVRCGAWRVPAQRTPVEDNVTVG